MALSDSPQVHLEWILDAGRPPTRARRVEETASLAAEGRRADQWRG